MNDEIVRKNIAFNNKVADDLNNLAGQIDKRLYAFAYYAPLCFVSRKSPQLTFFTAVINVYKLLWDCGAFIRTRLIGNRSMQIVPFPKTEEGVKRVKKLEDYFELVKALRTYYCHNFSEAIYINKYYKTIIEEWFSEHIKGSTFERMAEAAWEKALDAFLSETNSAFTTLQICIQYVLNLKDGKEKDRIIEYWLKEGIGGWYINTDEWLLNAAYFSYEHRYYEKYEKMPIKPILRQELYRILDNNFLTEEEYLDKYQNGRRIVGNYWAEWGNCIYDVLYSTDCPKPALPIPVIIKAVPELLHIDW